MPHSLEELKAPQLQTFQMSSLFFYHYKGLDRGGGCLVLFFCKQSWGGAYISSIFRENLLTVGQQSTFVSLLWSTLHLGVLKPACSCCLPLRRLAPVQSQHPGKTHGHTLSLQLTLLVQKRGLNPTPQAALVREEVKVDLFAPWILPSLSITIARLRHCWLSVPMFPWLASQHFGSCTHSLAKLRPAMP